MTVLTAVKRWIKRCPLGLYLVEKRKKRMYTSYLKKYTDREMIERLYRRANGGKAPDLEHPKMFTEKLQWLKLYYRDPRMIRCSDKAEVKDYLREMGLGELAVPTMALYERAEDVDERSLPETFVLKASHGCGWQWICRGDKTAINCKWAKKTMAIWLSESLYMFGREWNYEDQTPRMMAEPLLADGEIVDYKLMCFNGAVRAVQVNHAIDGKTYVDFYDAQWEKLDGMSCGVMPTSDRVLPRPAMWQRMIEVAQTLSCPFPFVRVDMYEADGRLYVGEMTFFPGSGFWTITPTERDEQFGEWLALPPKNNG